MEDIRLQDILNLVYQDIDIQERKLSGDFEKDKPLKWRIEGMKNIIRNINKLRNLKARSKNG